MNRIVRCSTSAKPRDQSEEPETSVLDSPILWAFMLTCLGFGTPFTVARFFSFFSLTNIVGLFIFGLPVVAGYLAVGLASFGVGIWQASRARWNFVIPCTVVPGIIAMLVVFPGTYGRFVNAADYVHFTIFSLRYERAVDATPKTEGPRLLWFFWTDASPPLSGQILIFLVFDESDELVLPDIQRSAAWKARYLSSLARYGYGGGEQISPHHLYGHYYVVKVRS